MNNLPLAVSSNPAYLAFANDFEVRVQPNIVTLMPSLVDICPVFYLPLLAQNFAIADEPIWMLAESEEQQRAVIKYAITYHKLKGTPASIKAMLDIFGQGDALIEENFNKQSHDGTILRNSLYSHGQSPISWAQWRITLNHAITVGQASTLFKALRLTAPARCQLVSINYPQAANRHNGAIMRNGNFTRGAVAQAFTGD